MNTFYYDKTYRMLLILLLLLCIVAIALGYYNERGTVPLKIATAFTFAVIVYLLPACISRVQIDGDIIYTRSLTGKRSLCLSDVDSASVIKLKGRYVIMLLTETKFISFDTICSDFMLMKELLRQHVPAIAFEKIEQITENDVLKAMRRLRLTVALICLLFVAIIVYFNFIK